MSRQVRQPFALAVAAVTACGTPVRPPETMPAPDVVVISRFDPPRTLLLERAPGDTVRIQNATSVLGRMRETRGDTAWIAATRVRALRDDGQGVVPGWRVAVVTDARTSVVPLARDTYTDKRGAARVGKTVAIGAAVAVAAYLLVLWGCSGQGSRCWD